MRAYARYSWVLVVLGLLAALIAGVLRLFDGQVTSRVQIGIAVSLVFLAGYLVLEAESIQKWAGGRQARYGANAVAMSVAFVAIVGILNYLSKDRYHTDWDLTENKQNTLAGQTVEVLSNLPEPVKATAFISSQSGSFRDETSRLLQNYRDKSNGKFTFEVVDPQVQPALAGQMGVTRDNTIVFTMGDRREDVQFGGEQEYTSALIKLTHPEQRVLYFIVGHGERDLADTSENGFSKAQTGLQGQNYTVQPLNLVVTTTVPSDAAALVVAGPTVPYSAQEVQVIGNYLQNGGSAIFLIDPTLQMRDAAAESQADPLVDWLQATWGITLNNDLVVDPASSQVTNPFTPVSLNFGSSPVTDNLTTLNLAVAFPLTRSIAVPTDATAGPAGVQTTPLVLTSAGAWGETDFNSLQSGASLDPAADLVGPLYMAVSAENSTNRARVVVFGDSDFAGNQAVDLGANLNILLNSVNWVTGNTDLISIPPRDTSFRPPLDTSNRTIAILGLASVCVLPFGVLLVGVAVVWNRRIRYK